MPDIILASASPRRRELLAQIGVRFHQELVEIDETPHPNEAPETYVVRLALEKARAVRARHGDDAIPVLGADTAVVIDGRTLGKPADAADARAMLELLSGRRHSVFSAVALAGRHEDVRVNESGVWFRAISSAEIDAYWRSGEPADKAGGYGIQGLGAVFVERLEGSYSGVMGLSLYETAALLNAFDIKILDRK